MYQYEQTPRLKPEWAEEPAMPIGGWSKPKGWTADDELWSENVRKYGLEYANRKAAERRK